MILSLFLSLILGQAFVLGVADLVHSEASALQSKAGFSELKTSGFGDIDERLRATREGRAFYAHLDDGTRLVSLRAELWKRPTGKSCQTYLRGIRSVPDGAIAPPMMAQLFLTLPVRQLTPLPPWEPVSPEELGSVRLLSEEKTALGRAHPESKKIIWEALILQRGQAYLESGTRDLYSTLSEPMDPWKVLETTGFSAGLIEVRKVVPELLVRKFAPSSSPQSLRQLIDRRHLLGERQSVMWSRSIYTDRLLDAFGEVLILDCPSESSPLRIVHGAVADLERLKIDGFWASLSRWRVRQVARGMAEEYLDSVAGYLKAK